MRRRPYSVVLLDEAEKAHTDLMELFYQVFDKGVLEDAEGVVVDFKNTMMLLATNTAAEAILGVCDGETRPGPEALVETIRPRLLEHFRPALLGRLAVVPYYPLEPDEIREIVHLKLRRIQDRIRANHMAELTYANDVVDEIAGRCTDRDTGARTIDYILNQTLLPEMSAELLETMARGETVASVNLAVANHGFAYVIES